MFFNDTPSCSAFIPSGDEMMNE